VTAKGKHLKSLGLGSIEKEVNAGGYSSGRALGGDSVLSEKYFCLGGEHKVSKAR